MGYLLKDQESIAICTFTTGETNIPKDKAELDKLQGNLIVFYDLDAAGIKGAEKVQATFPDRCRIAAVPAPPDAKEGYDVSDSLNGGFTLTDFFEAARSARTYKPPKKENPVRNKIVTNRELFDRAPDHVDFLVPDLLTEDELFVLAGPPRGGKSLLCMNLAKAIAEGGKFLDRPVMQGSVLYVNCEDSEAKVKERQIAQNWDPDSPVYWLNRFKLSELEHLIEVAKEIDDLRLIILDTLSRVRDDNCNESSADLSRVLEPLQEFAQEQKICIIITHHTSKLTAEELLDPFASIRGSGAIRATCRGAIVIAPGDNCYRLISENGHTEKLDIKIRCDFNNLEWKLMGRWQPRIASESVRDRVLDHLNLVGESTIDRISKDIQIASNTVKTTLWRLLADDLVTKRGGVKGSPATYSRGVHKVTVTESVPNCNADTLSAIGYKVTNNITNTPSEKVIIEPKSDHSNDHFSSHRSLLKDDSLVTKSVTERENLDAVRDTFGNTSDTCNRIEPNATVIIQEGRFYGLHAKVMAIDPDGLVEVRAENWSISRKYPIEQLKLVIDRGGDR
jgi:AAA domain